MMQTFLELASPQCSAEEFDGEIVALNLDTGIYFSMKDTASWIFSDLCKGYSVEEILKTTIAGTPIHNAVDAFIRDLRTAGLLRLRSEVAHPNGESNLLSASLETLQPPVLESFGDMQSLLLLDPVHEVDEKMGWPKFSST